MSNPSTGNRRVTAEKIEPGASILSLLAPTTQALETQSPHLSSQGRLQHINPQHFQEWRESFVDDDIIKLNVRSLEGDITYEYLLYSDELQRTNTGVLARGLLKAYSFLDYGGWWAAGVDPLNGWQEMLWGTLKPKCPRLNERGKIQKYENPLKVPTRTFFLQIPLHIWQRVAQRHGKLMPNDVAVTEAGEALGFWQWVLEENVLVVLTEGVKKAGSLLTCGYAAVGLPSHTGGYRNVKDEFGERTGEYQLTPDLEVFATSGREITFCFDSDEKPRTRNDVSRSINKTGNLLAAKEATVKVIWLPRPEKGIDDFIAARGANAFHQLYRQARTLKPDARALKRERQITQEEHVCNHSFPSWFRSQVAKIPAAFKGFKRPLKGEPQPQPKLIQYIPGKLLRPEQYKEMGCPVIRFDPGQRLDLIAELVPLGYHDILDVSGTGTSKSHDAGLAEPKTLGVDRLWYFSQDHRNPTTATVEANYVDMPVRNNGLFVDETRKTALDNPHVRWPKQGEIATEQGNCFRTKLFHTLAAKGFKHEVTAEAKLNPICASCHVADSCAGKGEASPGPGYSFRSDRREVFALSDRIRASLNSAPNPEDLRPKQKDGESEQEESKGDGAFFDEAMRQLSATDPLEAQLFDFDHTWAEIEAKLPAIHEQLKPVRLALREVLAGDIPSTQETYYGWNDAALRNILGSAPENLAEIIRQLKDIEPELEDILKKPDSFNLDGVEKEDRKDFTKQQSKRLRSLVRRNSYRESSNDLQSLPSRWLIPLLEVWGNIEPGAMRINSQTLSVMTRNNRHAEIAAALKWAVYLDATANREYLALQLNIDASDIVQIQQKSPSFENLTITQIDGLGLVGRERSESLKKRLSALKTELVNRHPDINFVDHKQHVEAAGGWWFVHSRGSNEFKTLDALATIGTPYHNIGHLQDIFITLTGDRQVDKEAPGFSAFVDWHTKSEIAQSPGRLRANLRPEQKVDFYFCADFDLNFLEDYYPGATIRKVQCFNIAPEAGTRTQQTCWRIQQAILAAAETMQKKVQDLTQVEVAALAKVSQGRIAQVVSEYGGWRAFLRLLVVLLDGLYSTANNSLRNNHSLTEEQKFFAQTYFSLVLEEEPPDIVRELLNTAQTYTWKEFKAILVATSFEVRGRLLAAMIGGLPFTLQDEFLQTVREVAL